LQGDGYHAVVETTLGDSVPLGPGPSSSSYKANNLRKSSENGGEVILKPFCLKTACFLEVVVCLPDMAAFCIILLLSTQGIPSNGGDYRNKKIGF